MIKAQYSIWKRDLMITFQLLLFFLCIVNEYFNLFVVFSIYQSLLNLIKFGAFMSNIKVIKYSLKIYAILLLITFMKPLVPHQTFIFEQLYK